MENPKKYNSATWLYSVDFYAWYFSLSCGLFSYMILHCDDGIRHVEAVLEEPTNQLTNNFYLCELLWEWGISILGLIAETNKSNETQA